ncbi:MAG: hypothetical protein LBR16_06275 [Treponema sp.]|jgi:hypothetical protein|nr:hypothetical protein [Treponema sp.]
MIYFFGKGRRTHKSMLLRLGFFLFSVSKLFAQNVMLPASMPETHQTRTPVFPAAYSIDYLSLAQARETSMPYWVMTEDEYNTYRGSGEIESIILNNDVLAFYGHPLSRNMGILGRYSKNDLYRMLTKLADEYGRQSGGRNIKKAFYLIYGTVWPEGKIGILSDAVILDYIKFAAEHDMLIFLDHQIGRYEPVASLKKMLPYLAYPNVHLALDPEWRTTKPMQEIGSVRADELNAAQKAMSEYLIEHNIAGERMLVIHQFNGKMISNREKVVTGYPKVRVVHCTDGFGKPHLKKQSYASNASAQNLPVKGFKLFYNLGIKGAGYDEPLLTPKEVYALSPRPLLVMYQ